MNLKEVKRNLFDPIRKSIAEALIFTLGEHGFESQVDPQEIHDALVAPPNADVGDLAFGCFILAKKLKTNPAQLAQKIAVSFKQNPLIEKVVASGPYLNFTLSVEEIGKVFLGPLLRGEQLGVKLFLSSPDTMIEFSQPNTHKELHVGHMRNACLGSALVHILKKAGVKVISSTFPGDQGTHVAKCLWYMKNKNKEPMPEEGRGEWLGKMYSRAHLLLEDEVGTPNEDKNRTELTAILKQLESQKGEYFDLWKETRKWSIDLMTEVYSWLGVEFDQWYWESEVDAASVKYVEQLFLEGKLVKSQGAIGMDLSSENLGFCLLLKSDGTGLYATKDLELARRKFQDYRIEKSIYVVDLRQALHFQQIFSVLKHLGFEQAANCYHLQYNFVELPDGAMSSRKGNIIPLTDLIENMQNMIRNQYLSRYQNEWSEEEVSRVANQVAQGAIKYGMLKIDNNKKIVFDMQEWLKLDGDSGPFIQYSAARIQSLIAKFSEYRRKVEDQHAATEKELKADWQLLQHTAEKKLILHLMDYQMTLAQAAETYRPSIVCTYLLEAAKKFNHFYHECSILQAEKNVMLSRISLCETTLKVLSDGLAVLGIPTPVRM